MTAPWNGDDPYDIAGYDPLPDQPHRPRRRYLASFGKAVLAVLMGAMVGAAIAGVWGGIW